jgi:hypothetical protein
MIRKKQDSEMAAQLPECQYGRRQPHQFGTRWSRGWVISTNRRSGNEPIGLAKEVRNFLDNLSQYI